MGWSKRGNGRSYDSLNGYAAIIGFMSHKVLDYTTRNRKCNKCDIGIDKQNHDCRGNYQGSAKGMEPDAGAQLINRSKVLQEAQLNVGVVIGDEDSNKLADNNHLIKHFVNELYELAKTFKEIKRTGVIAHLKKCFCYAIAQNKGKTSDLSSAILSIPDHVFNQHENCGDWCKRNDGSIQTIVLKDNDLLYNKLKEIFVKYAKNAAKFSVTASSQANESLNSIIVGRAPKAKCYSKSESADYRVASAILTKNEGDIGFSSVQKNLGLIPGKNTLSYFHKTDELRKTKSQQKTSKKEKTRRRQLAGIRQNLKKRKEKSEGVTYESNCGINRIDKEINLDQNVEKNILEDSECDIIYFDIETSGFEMSCDILQIAAISGSYEFSVYIHPTQSISSNATKKLMG